jgi:hypothetical protein
MYEHGGVNARFEGFVYAVSWIANEEFAGC